MEFFKRNPFFFSLLTLVLVAVIVGMWFAARSQTKLAEVKGIYEGNLRQLDSYLNRSIAPTRTNLQALESNYLALYRDFVRTSSLLNLNTYNKDRFFGEPPESKTEAFFEIASYVENARNAATSNKVGFAPDSRFGFNQYSNTGPNDDEIVRVHRQVKIMEWLLLSLMDSGVSEIVRVQRERYSDPKAKNTRSRGTSDTDLFGDEFSMPAGSSVETPGFIGTEAFRVAFKGQSLSLRNYLNRIVNSTLPFVVRGVEVSLANELDDASKRKHIADNPFFQNRVDDELLEAARVPIISENESIFIVTLEFLEMESEIEAPIVAIEEDYREEVGDA